ncbi:MAG: alpha/beta hydrolase [Opitutaceae bacterium]|jgi:acetyl esterase/lipase
MFRILALLLMVTSVHASDPLLRQEEPAEPLRQADLSTPENDSGEIVKNRPKDRNAFGLNRSISNITRASIALYRPTADATTALRTGVVICPGGGYSGVVIDKEGHDYARYLAGKGITALVLKYRLPDGSPLAEGQTPAPLEDALTALRWLRGHATDLDLAPDRIGIMGSSAGGHLAATAAAYAPVAQHHTNQSGEQISARPDFLVLIYPVITMDAALTHTSSRARLLGPKPAASIIDHFSIEKNITPDFPPTFVVHARDDPVKVDNSLILINALTTAGIPNSPHIFESGGHGFGLARLNPSLSAWPDALVTWVISLNLKYIKY